MSDSEPRERLRDWLAGINGCPRERIADGTQLLTEGLLTSLQLMELLLLLEELRGAPVRPEELVPGAFASLDAIVAGFLPQGVGDGR